MTRYGFLDDYSEGCHPRILEAMARGNLEQAIAYGEDAHSRRAAELIAARLGGVDATIRLVASGTQANLILIAAALRPHEAVIAAQSGHIVVRETGAIEVTGHKILTMPSADGKLTVDQIQVALDANAHPPHMVKPRLVYISNATELGTLYTKAELTTLSAFCQAEGLLLMLDGARLGAALTAERNDLTLAEVAELTDMFWIGGTKAGALLGEALVVKDPALGAELAFHIKQRGALLAKGRLLGLQFVALFEGDLYFEAGRHANRLAAKLGQAIRAAGHDLVAETETNQVFVNLPNNLITHLKRDFDFHVLQSTGDGRSMIRLVTSWATDEAQVDRFIEQVSG